MARGRRGTPELYLPPSLSGGNLPGGSQKGFPSPIGKSRSIQNMGNYTGARAAGITKGIAGPEGQFRHAFEHYGKKKESSLDDM
jgi:hypothetical protein